MNKFGVSKSLITFAAFITLAVAPNPAFAQHGGHGGGGGGGSTAVAAAFTAAVAEAVSTAAAEEVSTAAVVADSVATVGVHIAEAARGLSEREARTEAEGLTGASVEDRQPVVTERAEVRTADSIRRAA